MPGSPPDLVTPPPGCVFHPRCPHVKKICKHETPEMTERDGHLVFCWLYR
jgi:peptide/nickel transport system ATP-binding protein